MTKLNLTTHDVVTCILLTEAKKLKFNEFLSNSTDYPRELTQIFLQYVSSSPDAVTALCAFARGFELGYCVGQKDKEIEELNRIKDLA